MGVKVIAFHTGFMTGNTEQRFFRNYSRNPVQLTNFSLESLHSYNLFCFYRGKKKRLGKAPVRCGKIPRSVKDKHVLFPKPLKSMKMVSNNESPKEKGLFLLD